MELREFAEHVLFATTLQEKLDCPVELTDERPGGAIQAPATPGRPAELRFKPQHSGKTSLPGVQKLDRPGERGRLLHFFANHELLATELMALVLLRFPGAPPAFRRTVLQTLKEEQDHTRWYLHRMRECGVVFGELPVSGYFWRSVSGMDNPLDYVTGLSLTFEQANLDFARFFASGFAAAGDQESSRLLERIYRDEIGHVACGLKWFRKWKDPRQSDWEAFQKQLRFPLSAQRAKGPVFNLEGRRAAGFDQEFIDELNVFAQSKGRTPTVFLFNPFAEGRIAQGPSFTPNKHQQSLQRDLESLPQFLCRQDDVVLVERRPSAHFLSTLKETGYPIPEFVELRQGKINDTSTLQSRKIGGLRPWAWSPDSLELLEPLFPNVALGSRNPQDYYNSDRRGMYSKEWSAALLQRVISAPCAQATKAPTTAEREASTSRSASHPWLCTDQEIGRVAASVAEALDNVRLIRSRGHHAVVIKESLGVAGHNAIRLLEPEILEAQLGWISRAADSGRTLVIEPWLDRVKDFSVQLEMGPGGLQLIGYVDLLTNWQGQYFGNRAWPGFRRRMSPELSRLFPNLPDLAEHWLKLYSDIFEILEKELRSTGYLGPLGIDAFVYRTSGGECRLKPIVEINPRYTMGRLTLELMQNVAPGSTGTFRLVSRQMVHKDGFQDFSAWAAKAMERCPVRRDGQPVLKIREGLVCLSDPDRAQVCLPVFEAARAVAPERIG